VDSPAPVGVEVRIQNPVREDHDVDGAIDRRDLAELNDIHHAEVARQFEQDVGIEDGPHLVAAIHEHLRSAVDGRCHHLALQRRIPAGFGALFYPCLRWPDHR